MTMETREFKTEIKQILDLMIHSLYSHKEVFLRELISNASDAIDRARYESLTNKDIQEEDGEWKIQIIADKDAGTLTIRDNGIGMTKDEIIEALGTIAHSGTKDFLKALQEKEIRDNPELIGQFGVGFYSAFMVADRITVLSRKAGLKGTTGVKWESTGEGSFSFDDVEKAGKGTDVVLHLRDEEKKYLGEWEIRGVVKKYSDFIEHPIVMEVERDEESALEKGKTVKMKKEEVLNSRKALWLKDKSEVTEEEYKEFYRHVAHDFTDPMKTIHYKAEGTSEFSTLLYVPTRAPFNIFYKDYKIGPMLYVKRVQIMEHCEQLIPVYLRFIRGVVDSADLPLNVSREMLQNNRQVEIIKNNITKKVLDMLADMKKDEADQYRTFFGEFGKILKEGVHFDYSRREAIADLFLFMTTKSEDGKQRDLEEYLADMKDEQEAVYYITAATLEEGINSPYLEAFREKGYEVLICLDEIDDYILSGLEYKGKKFKSALKGDITLDKSDTEKKGKAAKEFGKLIDLVKEVLKDDVKDVRLSGRLTDSACCLVTEEGAIDPQMERLLKSMGQDVPAIKRTLEINPDHPLLMAMNKSFEKDSQNESLKDLVRLLYDQALILEGSKPKDPAVFARRMARLMVENADK